MFLCFKDGGLRGEYWDNIWFVDSTSKTQIDSEINFQWGTGAITTYGTDYVSIRWTGKVLAPYTEEYTFYLKADVRMLFYYFYVSF